MSEDIRDRWALAIAERDRLRSALLDVLTVESLDSAHLVAHDALDATTSELDQAVEHIELRDDRDRLRAIVEVMREAADAAVACLDGSQAGRELATQHLTAALDVSADTKGDHDHCDHDLIECTYDALVGEYREAVAERDRLRTVVQADRRVLDLGATDDFNLSHPTMTEAWEAYKAAHLALDGYVVPGEPKEGT